MRSVVNNRIVLEIIIRKQKHKNVGIYKEVKDIINNNYYWEAITDVSEIVNFITRMKSPR